MTKATLVNQAEKYWDRLFAPGGHCGIVTTVDTEGRVNAASFATCVRIVHNPVQIAFTTSLTGHTSENLLATGAFVVNLPSFERDILEKVRIVGLPFARGVDELEKAGLTALPSTKVKPPRIAECLRHFECEVVWTKEWLKRMMVVGNVVAASTYSDCVDPKGYIVWDRVKPVAFAGAPYVNMFVAAHEVMEVVGVVADTREGALNQRSSARQSGSSGPRGASYLTASRTRTPEGARRYNVPPARFKRNPN
jgi:flavin reductase (DIM6/NTAB) family NADH-FMN oxidoreductase RutF